MADPLDNTPSIEEMLNKQISPAQWLNYYRNVWQRCLIARTIDVQSDLVLKAKNPDELVINMQTGQQLPVKQRLEDRKMLVSDALEILESIDYILNIHVKSNVDGAKTIAETYWTPEALKVAEDMLPPKQAGDPCMIDGKEGTLEEQEGKEGLVCVPNDKEAVKTEEKPVEANNTQQEDVQPKENQEETK